MVPKLTMQRLFQHHTTPTNSAYRYSNC